MPAHSRLGDKWYGFCNIHGGPQYGTIITASPNVYDNNIRTARKTDLVQADDCKCVDQIIQGSPNVFDNSLDQARIGDPTKGDPLVGNLITGSPNVFANG